MEKRNTSKRVKEKNNPNDVIIRWDNKNIISSVASTATAKANRETKRITENVVEMDGATLVRRDANTGKFIKIKEIDPIVVNNGKNSLFISMRTL